MLPLARAADTPRLLIPFAGRLTAACRAALPALALPRLGDLLARLTLQDEDAQDDDTLSPPHERALARALGIQTADGCLPWAALEAQRAGLAGAHGQPWALVTLCHWQVGMSEVVLGDPASLGISAAESDALLACALPFFEEDGIALFTTGQPGLWLARSALFDGLDTASLDRAIGQPLASWLPMSDAARPLRRLQNEMQMLLYTTHVNDDRIARGQLPINSFWLSGTGRLPQPLPAQGPQPTVDLALRDAALQDDGEAWSKAWQALDAGPIADLLAHGERGEAVELTLCGDRAARRWIATPRSLLQRVRGRFGRQRTADVLEAL
ncbi:hypothetical protein [Xenophilus azovorans]|uniref:hypothetical protein n=1 Tax=Xenophilus azovorans TaxID=151755 RepID=UPI00056EF18D|nr:hypothetical protein [Xenophilus azovorans]